MGGSKMPSALKKTKSSMQHPRVLFVIPTLGERLDLLRQTLQSLAIQGSKIVDVVVVCPPKSPARKLATQFGATCTDDPGGLSAALNVGFALAKPWHDYASWMGDDDLLRPASLATTIAVLDANPKAVVAYGRCDYIDDKGRTIFTSKAGRLAPWIMTWGPNLLPLIGILYRLHDSKGVGGYDPSLKYSMDLDMWLRLKKRGDFIDTHKTLGAFRWHSTSTTVANRNISLTETEMVKRRYMPKPIQQIAFLWELPVRLATRFAAHRVTSLAQD